MQAVSVSEALDYEVIANATLEIKKRAARLKDNLALPKPEINEKKSKERRAPDRKQVKASLYILDQSIMSFVTNPGFQNADVVDAHLSVKASTDLAKIIELSESIRQSAKSLRNATQK